MKEERKGGKGYGSGRREGGRAWGEGFVMIESVFNSSMNHLKQDFLTITISTHQLLVQVHPPLLTPTIPH